jgi:hypothetical protein
MNKRITAGETVVVVLHTPREKCWGLLDDINPAGVFLRGLDLNAFDDWVNSVAHEEPFIGLSDLFFPMWRVERVNRDEHSLGIPSLAAQAEHRTGRSLTELMGSDQTPPEELDQESV